MKKVISIVIVMTLIVFAGFGPISYGIAKNEYTLKEIIYFLLELDFSLLMIILASYICHKLLKWSKIL